MINSVANYVLDVLKNVLVGGALGASLWVGLFTMAFVYRMLTHILGCPI